MFHIISIFLITSLISFCGSIQLGPVNLVIMKEVLEGKRKSGLLIGAGVCIPEFIYSFFALYAASWLIPRHQLLLTLEWAIVPVMLGLGIFSLFKKKKEEEIPSEENEKDEIKKVSTSRNLAKGIFLSALNPQLLPFWLAILVMLNGYPFFNIETLAHRLAFVLGTGAGEFVLIMLVVWLTARHREFLLRKMKKWNLNKVFGSLFIALALFQSLKLIFSH
jgi:threonine/homoserine/homoserine lactone efflux protein